MLTRVLRGNALQLSPLLVVTEQQLAAMAVGFERALDHAAELVSA